MKKLFLALVASAALAAAIPAGASADGTHGQNAALNAPITRMPSPAQFKYVHVGACQSALRGYSTAPGADLDHDDDIHAWGVRYSMPGFNGYGGYRRNPANPNQDLIVHLSFYTGSTTPASWAWGRCYQSGAADDRIVDYITWTMIY